MGGPVYTMMASQALDLAKLFTLMVGLPPIPTPGGVFAIDLTTPHGPSTGGGAQALQHITLVHGDVVITVGTLDPVAHVIELRGYDHVATLFRKRWNKLLPIQRAAYETFATRVGVFARSQHYTLAHDDVAPVAEAVPESAPAKSSPVLTILIVVIVLAAVAVAIVLARQS